MDCSTCYERVPWGELRHGLSGAPAALVSLAMQMYAAPRMVHAHGSVSTTRRPGRGIIAGRGFAVWFLKAYLAPVIRWARAPRPAVHVRDYADDIVVYDQATHPADALGPVVAVVTRLVEVLESEGHQFAAAKTQLWGPSRAARTVWSQVFPKPPWAPTGEAMLGPTTPWGGVQTRAAVVDLGVDVGRNGQRPRLLQRLADAQDTARRVAQLPMFMRPRYLRTLVLPRGLYGVEVNPLTERQVRNLRHMLATTLGARLPLHAGKAFLLVTTDGDIDPEVWYALRVAKLWASRLRRAPGECAQLWELARPEVPQGPLGRLKQALQRAGWHPAAPDEWICSQGLPYRVDDPGALLPALRADLIASVWRQQIPQRSRYRDLGEVNHEATRRVWQQAAQASKPWAGALRTALCDGMRTRTRSHCRTAAEVCCPFCRSALDTHQHQLWSCPRLHRWPTAALARLRQARREYGPVGGMWLTGVVPRAFLSPTPSAEMHRPPSWLDQATGPMEWVCTDGSCIDTPLGPRAGWGIYAGPCQAHGGPLPGPRQTAQRAEVYALVQALRLLPRCGHVYTDSQYVEGRVLAFGQAGYIPYVVAHRDLWCQALESWHPAIAVTWIKAHLDWPEAQQRGYPWHAWHGNSQADLLAGLGSKAHSDEAGQLREARKRQDLITLLHRHLGQTVLRAAKLVPRGQRARERHRPRRFRERPLLRRLNPTPQVRTGSSAAAPGLEHHWYHDGAFRRCSNCGRENRMGGRRSLGQSAWVTLP